MNKTRTAVVAAMLGVIALATPVIAQSTPQVIKLQGFLSDTSGGNSVPANGTFSMTFDLYDADLGGLLIRTPNTKYQKPNTKDVKYGTTGTRPHQTRCHH